MPEFTITPAGADASRAVESAPAQGLSSATNPVGRVLMCQSSVATAADNTPIGSNEVNQGRETLQDCFGRFNRNEPMVNGAGEPVYDTLWKSSAEADGGDGVNVFNPLYASADELGDAADEHPYASADELGNAADEHPYASAGELANAADEHPYASVDELANAAESPSPMTVHGSDGGDYEPPVYASVNKSGGADDDDERTNLRNSTAARASRAAARVSDVIHRPLPSTVGTAVDRLQEVKNLSQALNKYVGNIKNGCDVGIRENHADLTPGGADLRGRTVEVLADMPVSTSEVMVVGSRKLVSGDEYAMQMCLARKHDLDAYERSLTERLKSDPTTRAALLERQALSARNGVKVLAETVNELAKGDIDVRTARSVIQNAIGLLQDAAGGGLAADSSEPIRVSSKRDMQLYLGIKKASASEKAAATQDFVRKVDQYLDVDRLDQQAMTNQETAMKRLLLGPDFSRSSALTPNEKVALVIERTLKKSVSMDGLSEQQQVLFEQQIDPKHIGDEIVESLKQDLRANQFVPIKKDIALPVTGSHTDTESSIETYHSEMLPATTISSEDFGREGVLCSDTHSLRVPNLWTSEYRSPAGSNLFQGVRHGTISAYGINAKSLKALPRQELHHLIEKLLPEQLARHGGIDTVAKRMTSRFSLSGARLRKDARLAATQNRAEELVKFNLLNNEAAMKQLREGKTSIDLDLPSIMLVTPDSTRGLFSNKYDELRMTREQDSVLKALSRQPLDMLVNVDGKRMEIKVNVRPLTFSMGVNSLALNKAYFFMPSWRTADAINRGSIERLIGKGTRPGHQPESGLVADYLKDPTKAGSDKYTVRQLTDQIARLWRAKAHHGENNDPYALPARLALLTSKLGLTPSINCKSGKDRTGQLDAEIKYLATQIERNAGNVPEPGVDLSDSDKNVYRALILGAGNHEIQKINTGHAGYKVKLRSITQRLGSLLAQFQHMGQGAYTNA